MVSIEWTLNAWTVGIGLFAVAGFYWATVLGMRTMKGNIVEMKTDIVDMKTMKTSFADMKTNVVDIQTSLKTMSIVLERLAVQSTRLDNQGEHLAAQGKLISTLESRIFELSKGHGFIQRDINGEYPR